MRCIWSTDTSLNAALTRLIHGGSATHCAVMMADGWVMDSRGDVAVSQIGHWRETHRILAAYDVPLPKEARAIMWAIEQRGQRMRSADLVLGAWLQGGLTLSDRAPRPSVRMLREIAHALGRDVTAEYQ